jgi:hypothetical protein
MVSSRKCTSLAVKYQSKLNFEMRASLAGSLPRGLVCYEAWLLDAWLP